MRPGSSDIGNQPLGLQEARQTASRLGHYYVSRSTFRVMMTPSLNLCGT